MKINNTTLTSIYIIFGLQKLRISAMNHNPHIYIEYNNTVSVGNNRINKYCNTAANPWWSIQANSGQALDVIMAERSVLVEATDVCLVLEWPVGITKPSKARLVRAARPHEAPVAAKRADIILRKITKTQKYIKSKLKKH